MSRSVRGGRPYLQDARFDSLPRTGRIGLVVVLSTPRRFVMVHTAFTERHAPTHCLRISQ
jgi:hypothetical protein